MANHYGEKRMYFERGKSLYRGKHRFEIGQTVVCNWNYSTMKIGSRWKIFAITRSGSLKLEGQRGSYLPEKFLSISDYEAREAKEVEVASSNSVYIAILLGNDPLTTESSVPELIESMCENITRYLTGGIIDILIDRSKASLQARVNQRIAKNNSEKWMIFYGHSVAESNFQVSYRNV